MVAIPNAPRMGDMPKGEPVPEGTYHLRCDKSTYKTTGPNSKSPGSPMAECQLTIFGPDEAEEFHGRKIFENFMLSGEGMFRTRQFLEAAGWGDNDVLDDTDKLVSLEVAAVVTIDEARTGEDGKAYPARNRVAKYQPI